MPLWNTRLPPRHLSTTDEKKCCQLQKPDKVADLPDVSVIGKGWEDRTGQYPRSMMPGMLNTNLTTWEAVELYCDTNLSNSTRQLHTARIPWGRVSRTPAGLTGSGVVGGRTRQCPHLSTLVAPPPNQPGPGTRGWNQVHTRLEHDSTIERTPPSAC